MSENGDPNEMAEDVNELLLSAAMDGSVEGVNAALEAGADIDFDQLDDWNPGDDTTLPPSTALLIACQKGHVDVVKLLLHKGASLVKRSMGASAPLHAAASNGWTEIVDLLVQHGATVDIQDGFYDTPIIGACRYKHVDTVRRLIELGARPDLTNGHVGQKWWREVENYDSVEESVKLLQEARKTKLLRCCNPKCGKPGYRKTLKLCAGCKLTRYCSRDCQIQHWSVGHKKCCGHDAYTEERPDLEKKFLLYIGQHLQIERVVFA
ncbi:ankyrin repeat domain-containing protein 1-like isoform X3 [Branchiostoma floridae]|uniref:Ankyrin repeat domain-containing protein 1-like isoform X3 n=1 Tax=Branchiostoma floridae TaxID=7739 RepID=A0A9J7LYM5_BRAFL|nr:ankyrin repeat domain-containing protein 1-like isoform X3 [Branchiostoma floridae]